MEKHELILSSNKTTNGIRRRRYVCSVSTFLGATRSMIQPISYGNVAGWLLAGWVGGCLSQPVLYQND